MHKLLPLLALIVTASISAGRPAAAEGRFAGPLSGPFATDVAGPDATVVFVAGMGGGTTSGGMRGGPTGGMGGGGTTGGGVFGTPAPSFGTNGSSDWPGNSAALLLHLPVRHPGRACSFVAPASLRSSSLRAGARCSCAEGQSQGQIK